MTREEAISDWTFRSNHIKKWLDEHGEEPSIRHYVELIDMAIEALSAVCDDCIWHVCNYNKVDWDVPSAEADRPTKHTLPDGSEINIDEESYEVGYTEGQMADRPTGWIPVAEMLPEKDELVLVTVWSDVSIAWRNRYGGWESAEDMYGKGNVIAWMHLPEPYREDGEA